MKAVYALCPDPASAQRAFDGLRAAGIGQREIIVLSSEPFEDYEFGRKDQATLMPWIAAVGGLIGMGAGYWLTSTTQTLWPLATGGMPIVSMWPNLIVMFELTMLGGILATGITLLVTAGIPSRQATLYDPEVSDGKILVGVQNPPDASLEELQRALSASGGGGAKTMS